jgi:hypothetical protein
MMIIEECAFQHFRRIGHPHFNSDAVNQAKARQRVVLVTLKVMLADHANDIGCHVFLSLDAANADWRSC